MRIRLEYEAKGLIVPDEDITYDTEDAFAFNTKKGVMGFNRTYITWWRDRTEEWPNKEERLELDELFPDLSKLVKP